MEKIMLIAGITLIISITIFSCNKKKNEIIDQSEVNVNKTAAGSENEPVTSDAYDIKNIK